MPNSDENTKAPLKIQLCLTISIKLFFGTRKIPMTQFPPAYWLYIPSKVKYQMGNG